MGVGVNAALPPHGDHSYRRLGGSQSQSERLRGKKNISYPCRNSNRDRPIRSPVEHVCRSVVYSAVSIQTDSFGDMTIGWIVINWEGFGKKRPCPVFGNCPEFCRKVRVKPQKALTMAVSRVRFVPDPSPVKVYRVWYKQETFSALQWLLIVWSS
jgi:hypothetical protein